MREHSIIKTGGAELAADDAFNERARPTKLMLMMRFIDAMPKGTSLRDRSGALKPEYPDTKPSAFHDRDIWHSAARMAMCADMRMTTYTGSEIVRHFEVVPAVIFEKMAEQDLSGVDAAMNFQTFSHDVIRECEKAWEGLFGEKKDHDDIADWHERVELIDGYFRQLRPDWMPKLQWESLGWMSGMPVRNIDIRLDELPENKTVAALRESLGHDAAIMDVRNRIGATMQAEWGKAPTLWALQYLADLDGCTDWVDKALARFPSPEPFNNDGEGRFFKAPPLVLPASLRNLLPPAG